MKTLEVYEEAPSVLKVLPETHRESCAAVITAWLDTLVEDFMPAFYESGEQLAAALKLAGLVVECRHQDEDGFSGFWKVSMSMLFWMQALVRAFGLLFMPATMVLFRLFALSFHVYLGVNFIALVWLVAFAEPYFDKCIPLWINLQTRLRLAAMLDFLCGRMPAALPIPRHKLLAAQMSTTTQLFHPQPAPVEHPIAEPLEKASPFKKNRRPVVELALKTKADKKAGIPEQETGMSALFTPDIYTLGRVGRLGLCFALELNDRRKRTKEIDPLDDLSAVACLSEVTPIPAFIPVVAPASPPLPSTPPPSVILPTSDVESDSGYGGSPTRTPPASPSRRNAFSIKRKRSGVVRRLTFPLPAIDSSVDKKGKGKEAVRDEENGQQTAEAGQGRIKWRLCRLTKKKFTT